MTMSVYINSTVFYDMYGIEYLVLVLLCFSSLGLPVLHEGMADGVNLGDLRGVRKGLERVLQRSFLEFLVRSDLLAEKKPNDSERNVIGSNETKRN